jgi:hypothetical protein
MKPIGVMILWLSLVVQAYDISFPYPDKDYTSIPTNEWSTYIWWIIKSGTVYQDSLTVRLIQAFYDAEFNPNSTQPAQYYVKFLIDVALSLVAFIALCLLIYYLYIIFFGDREKNISQAKNHALNAFIAICLIGVSWMIVSFAFYMYSVLTAF